MRRPTHTVPIARTRRAGRVGVPAGRNRLCHDLDATPSSNPAEPQLRQVGMVWRVPIATINGQQINYIDGGAGPVIIATHATLMDLVSLEPVTARLVAAGYRVVAFDLRGHGKTVYDQQPYDYLDVAGDVIGLADHLDVDRFTFFGEGQGAVVALRTALRAPDRVRALALLGPTADAASDGENAALDTAMDMWCADGPTLLWRNIAEHATATPEDAAALVARWESSAWRDYRPAANALATRTRFVDQLTTITCPALIMHGTADYYVPIQLGQEVAENLGGPTKFVPIKTDRQAITIAFDRRVADQLITWLHSVDNSSQ